MSPSPSVKLITKTATESWPLDLGRVTRDLYEITGSIGYTSFFLHDARTTNTASHNRYFIIDFGMINLQKFHHMAFLKPVNGIEPRIGAGCYLADNATVVGDVVLGEQCSVWFNAVIRGDVNSIRIGDRVNVQDGAVIHCTWQ